MINKGSHLKYHLELLIEHDPNFREYWFAIDEPTRSRFIGDAMSIHSVCGDDDVEARFAEAHDHVRRRMVTVQQRDFEHSRLPKDWPIFILDYLRRQALYDGALRALTIFLRDAGLDRSVRVYGGLKVLANVESHRFKAKKESKVQQALEDTWDAVRFRMIVPTLAILEGTCLTLWRNWFDSILRCRNYYFLPKAGAVDHTYRAVHFQIALDCEYPFELQVMSSNSELISHMEHPFFFKQRIPFQDRQHETWLRLMCKKALILDYQTLAKVRQTSAK